MNILLQTSLVKRSLPFSESIRNSKRTLYFICDHPLEFWYGTYSPHRSRWHLYEDHTKYKFIHDHASKILERCYRDLFPDAERFWDGKIIEFDSVRYADSTGKNLIISEIKHKYLSKKERIRLEFKVSEAFKKSKLASNFVLKQIEILDTQDVLSKIIRS